MGSRFVHQARQRTIGDRLYDFVDRAKNAKDADAMQSLGAFLGEHNLSEFLGDNKSAFATASEVSDKVAPDDLDIFLQTVESGEPYNAFEEDSGEAQGSAMQDFTDPGMDEDQGLDSIEAEQMLQPDPDQSLADIEAEDQGANPGQRPDMQDPEIAPFPGKAPSEPNLEQ